ncbi:MAG: beta-lactamase protein [Bacillota bacterium]|jgi:glyoxylase-like metal-dependent hydrolase (beta-lactamase superfamily II)|nr:beta-lactamase protein [Bacillota bacterium]
MCDIIILDIEFQFAERKDVIHPVVLKDSESMVLIDCGYTGFLPELERAMKKKGLRCSDLTHVIITHQDHDHMGALAALKEKYPEIKVAASEEEAPYVSGQRKSLRLEQAEAMQPHLPEAQKQFGLVFTNILRNVQPASVDMLVKDGDLLPWCGGCTVIGTPGHTPGHISLFVNRKEVLITGDAAALENGELVIANPQFTLNLEEANRSLDKIKAYGAKQIICYHGGIYLPKVR